MSLTVIHGNALDALRSMPSGLIHCVVTSPPYWSQRDYEAAGQMGAEPTIDEHLAVMVRVFAEVRRVLRDDGSLFLNYGDAYAGGNNKAMGAMAGKFSSRGDGACNKFHQCVADLPPKNLLLMPFRVAFALQADGWILRRDQVWYKPNATPDSCVDRTSNSHEYVFHFSKQRRYYFNHDAIKEPVTGGAKDPGTKRPSSEYLNSDGTPVGGARGMRSPRSKSNESFNKAMMAKPGLPERRSRSVWFIHTKGYRGAHFATFPPALAQRCILAGCPPGGIVMDPFHGAGTTMIEAFKAKLAYVGIELREEYITQSLKRLADEHAALKCFYCKHVLVSLGQWSMRRIRVRDKALCPCCGTVRNVPEYGHRIVCDECWSKR